MEIVFAGFGGQGVLTAGLIVAEMALENGKNVTWMPAYGPTMRGGKAYSVVKYADGMLIVNTNNVSDDAEISDKFDVFRLPCLTLAQEANNPKAANIVAIGALIGKCGLFPVEQAKAVLKQIFVSKGKEKYTAMNEAAFVAGLNAVTADA